MEWWRLLHFSLKAKEFFLMEKRNTLSRVLGRTDIIAIGFGTMVGWSWIMMAASWVSEAGILGTVTAFAIGGALILAIGSIYGELTAALPLAGGEFVYAYRALGSRFALVVGWIMALAYLGVAAWEGIALATAIDYVLPIADAVYLFEIAGYQVYLSWAFVGVAGALIITLLNIFGVRPAILLQVTATAALIVIVLVMFIGGFTFGDTDNLGDIFKNREGFSYVLMMIPAMLIGFDVIPQSAEEMNIGEKNIGKMIIVCIVLSLIWYVMMATAAGFAAPAEIRDSGIIPMADVAAYLFSSEAFSAVIIVAGILGILTTWNGFFMGATRLIFAMGRARIIPEVFGRVHEKYGTPWAACTLVGVLCAASPFLGRNALIWFINTSSFCALIAYCLVILSFIVLRKKDSMLERPYKVRGGTAFGAVILLITFLYLVYYVVDTFTAGGISPEFVITGIWIIIGVTFTFAAEKRKGSMSEESREYLIFGSRFARKGEGQ